VRKYFQNNNFLSKGHENPWSDIVTLRDVISHPHRDKVGEDIHDDWEQAKHDYKEAHLLMSALQIMKSGDISQAVQKDDTESKCTGSQQHIV